VRQLTQRHEGGQPNKLGGLERARRSENRPDPRESLGGIEIVDATPGGRWLSPKLGKDWRYRLERDGEKKSSLSPALVGWCRSLRSGPGRRRGGRGKEERQGPQESRDNPRCSDRQHPPGPTRSFQVQPIWASSPLQSTFYSRPVLENDREAERTDIVPAAATVSRTPIKLCILAAKR